MNQPKECELLVLLPVCHTTFLLTQDNATSLPCQGLVNAPSTRYLSIYSISLSLLSITSVLSGTSKLNSKDECYFASVDCRKYKYKMCSWRQNYQLFLSLNNEQIKRRYLLERCLIIVLAQAVVSSHRTPGLSKLTPSCQLTRTQLE